MERTSNSRQKCKKKTKDNKARSRGERTETGTGCELLLNNKSGRIVERWKETQPG